MYRAEYLLRLVMQYRCINVPVLLQPLLHLLQKTCSHLRYCIEHLRGPLQRDTALDMQ